MAKTTLLNRVSPGFKKDVVLELSPAEAVALASVLAHMNGAGALLCQVYDSMYGAGVPYLTESLVKPARAFMPEVNATLDKDVIRLINGTLPESFVENLLKSYRPDGGDDAV